eukprot:7386224-Prymnesium_polylepis.1
MLAHLQRRPHLPADGASHLVRGDRLVEHDLRPRRVEERRLLVHVWDGRALGERHHPDPLRVACHELVQRAAKICGRKLEAVLATHERLLRIDRLHHRRRQRDQLAEGALGVREALAVGRRVKAQHVRLDERLLVAQVIGAQRRHTLVAVRPVHVLHEQRGDRPLLGAPALGGGVLHESDDRVVGVQRAVEERAAGRLRLLRVLLLS